MSVLKCPVCGNEYDINRSNYLCDKCGNILEVIHENDFVKENFRGVWRYKSIIHPGIDKRLIVTRGEGNTFVYGHENISSYSGIKNIKLKHEGENPTGSFKDRGMTVAVSEAMRLGYKKTLCASTGNTSASAASYSAMAGIENFVLIPDGKIAVNKLAQAYVYGSKIIKVPGNFDDAMGKLMNIISKNNNFYVLNSINPWRVEGQKTIAFEILEENEPDFIALPAGNLGNTTAIGKAIKEFHDLGLIKKIPRIVSVQAEGASPFYNLVNNHEGSLNPVNPETIASAIRIGNPVNWKKALKYIKFTKGIVEKVTDDEILNAKRIIDRSGIGCETASAASLAGVKKLSDAGIIDRNDEVFCILTGNVLKDIHIENINSMDINILS
ncbi:threonine synthase [Picrophilus oshimae]|uniref:Threonine synthase n=1 Tax=Picrophilus torridus (strain ATCC 700027 / DSM 9790 / JCM 10055 / NBRC 100828 / KAW 2/3) TaxID=1122961 RepID=Q6L077_PICTO|nr:threonine synthase [Picrophilus oshimae]AAT43625.1 threonine synthase [Picrophilus oshimae DSM 9789]